MCRSSSKPGVGSTVSIQLPLTLAIVNAMIVRFRDFRLAIPVTDVHEIYGLSRSEIFESQGREMIDVRGTLLPLYRLDELFDWNDFLPPLIYLHDQRLYTVALGLNFFRSSYQVSWAYLMAASLVTMLPVLLVFFFAQRLFIEGISLTGIKG